MFLRSFVFAALLVIGTCATADIYQCIDPETGTSQFTNIPPKPKSTNCKTIVVSPPNVASQPAPAPAAKGSSKAAPMPSPANFPRVDRETQQTRDSQRKRILEQELTNEQKLLEQAKKDLAEQESVRLGTERNYQKMLDRLEPYQKKVKQHEDNIASLRKELSNLR